MLVAGNKRIASLTEQVAIQDVVYVSLTYLLSFDNSTKI
jgi:hypothetical protein